VDSKVDLTGAEEEFRAVVLPDAIAAGVTGVDPAGGESAQSEDEVSGKDRVDNGSDLSPFDSEAGVSCNNEAVAMEDGVDCGGVTEAGGSVSARQTRKRACQDNGLRLQFGDLEEDGLD
jgi:hypothetical protein